MSAHDCDAAFAERQVVTAVAASRNARQFVEGIATADDFASIMNRRLFVAGMERDVVEFQEERVEVLAAAAGWHENDLWALLDADDRLCHIDASRFARRVVELAEARRLTALLADAHHRLSETGDVDAVLGQLRRWVA